MTGQHAPAESERTPQKGWMPMNHSEPRAVTAHTQPPLPRAQRALVQPVLEGTLVGLAAMLVGVVMLGLWWLPASSDRLLRHTSEQLAGQQAAVGGAHVRRPVRWPCRVPDSAVNHN